MMQVCSENGRWEVGMGPFYGSSFLWPMPTARLSTEGRGMKRRIGSSGRSSLS